jgi:two-component system sensor histidine kinase/response regulator
MGRRIFAISDNPGIIDTLRREIEPRGWAFDFFGLIEGAIPPMESFKPDLLLLDLTLPDGSGLELCKRIRRTPALENLPIIILTTRAEVKYRRAAFAAGAQDYVIKPFDLFELIARIGVHLAEKSGDAGRDYKIAGSRVHDRVRLDVVDMIMHDMRTPLGTVKMVLDIFEANGMPDGMKKRFLDTAQTSVDTALLMMNDHLDISAGGISAHLKPLKLEDLFHRLETVFLTQFSRRGVYLTLDCPADVEILTDGVILFRILQNLIGNALKFSKPGKTVAVRASTVDGALTLEVTDQGPGIADKQAIFEAPRTLPSPDGKHGFGIGLKFCRIAAESLQGTLVVEDVPGGGSRFICRCPAQGARPARVG